MTAGRPLTELLTEAESLLRAGARTHAGPGDAEERAPASRERLAHVMGALEEAIAERPAEARRHARRVDALRALYALRTRDLPAEALGGLYEEIRAGVTADPFGPEHAWRRAGMSDAFLDAPRSLVLWRRTALAACLLLVVATGFQLGGARLLEAPSDDGIRPMRLIEAPGDAGAPGETSGVRGGRFVRTDSRTGGLPGTAVGFADRSRHGGVHLFRTGRRNDADARRMLDRIKIFPVPGREAEDVEEN